MTCPQLCTLSDLSAMARLEVRQEESAPVLAQLRKKLFVTGDN